MSDLIKAATEIRDAFKYDPGHNYLDNEQPIHITIPLGTWRRLNYALSAPPSDLEMDRLRKAQKFAGFALDEYRGDMGSWGCDLDGGWLQDVFADCGLIQPIEVTADVKQECEDGEGCPCSVGDTCYRVTDAGFAAIKATVK